MSAYRDSDLHERPEYEIRGREAMKLSRRREKSFYGPQSYGRRDNPVQHKMEFNLTALCRV